MLGASLLAFGLGSTAAEKEGTVYAVSDAHLDTQWNWDVQSTIRDHILKTINRNLLLLREYPDYVFNFEGGVKYAWMKEYYPREFELVKDYIRQGRWHVSGASWDANDVIMPSVESQIRNIMLGQDFYRKEFGIESTDIFLPDCFGFGWTLPTIASHCGLIGFSSQKLDWRHHNFHGDSKHPFTLGLWQGVDGSRVMLAHGYNYAHRWPGDTDLTSDSELRKQAARSPLGKVYRYYGTGDTGGSPTIGSVIAVSDALHADGPLEVRSVTSDALFKEYLPYASHPELPVYDGELLMDVHGTGCYTSQAAMKLYNRQNEQLGDAAERAAVMATVLTGAPYPGEAFTEGWRRFIWHQFHDDLTGTSIPRAYEFSWNDELLTLKQFSGLLGTAITDLSSRLNTAVKGAPMVIFNPSGTRRDDVVEVSVPAASYPATCVVKDQNGKRVKAQISGYADGKAKLLVSASIPPMGCAVYEVSVSGRGVSYAPKSASVIENSRYKITFDKVGDITSLIDKSTGRELVKEGGRIRLAMFKGNPSYDWPAWEIMKSTLDRSPESITANAKVEMVEDGTVRKTVRVTKEDGDSRFVQYIHLYEGALAGRVDFRNEIDWASTDALLKAEFPLTCDNKEATYDLGVGVARRGNNIDRAYEVPAQQWANLTHSSGSHGVTILNNCKYGWDKPDDSTLRLTLLHTPSTRNAYTYQDHQDFGHHSFTYSLIPHDGALDRAAAVAEGERLNQGLKCFIPSRHKGEGRELSFVKSESGNIAIRALKRAEDGKGYIVRVYETAGRPATGKLTFCTELLTASAADGTEKPVGDASFNGKELNVALPANGIATYRIDFRTPAAEVRREMAAVDLPFDTRAFSWNEFRGEGEFAGGYTYAAELVPDVISSREVEFSLNPRAEHTAVRCDGQSLTLPAGKWDTLHLLTAAMTEDTDIDAQFIVNGNPVKVRVPSYTGFVGQWGHTGHTEGYMKPETVAYVGTHRHSSAGDEPYEYTYMYHTVVPVPEGTVTVQLPSGGDVAVFAATVTEGMPAMAEASSLLFETAGSDNPKLMKAGRRESLLKPEMITGWSGFVVESEHPRYLVDGDTSTKWCDVSGAPAYVDFDLGRVSDIKGWKLVNAANEYSGYVTAGCYLMGKSEADDEWRTLDAVRGNRRNLVERGINPDKPVRYLRLMVTDPTQPGLDAATRIYELEVY